MILFFISFVAGVITVLAPCILPLLPVIVGGSLSGEGSKNFNRKKAFTIITSLGISVILFTILLKVSTLFIGIPEDFWKWISGGIVLILGLITIFPSLWEGELMAKLNLQSNILLGKGDSKKSFTGDVIVGAALGPVFSTCSPTYFIILATVLPVAPVMGVLYLLTYAVGLCLALLFISVVGQKIINKLGIVADPRGWFKRGLGVLFLIVGLAIILGFDKKAQLFILDRGFFDVTRIEQKLLEKNTKNSNESNELNTKSGDSVIYLSPKEKEERFDLVPDISSPDGFINTEGKSISLKELRGKVVLLDIWTYSCINCQRTLPYINEWYRKYKDQGLVIVGLHTPEFAFEKVLANVEKAVTGFGIQYPVVLDNDYSTWRALGNQYWPRKYLIDVDGYIVYDHIGEGGYIETEMAIQKALQERNIRLGINQTMPQTSEEPEDFVKVDSGKVRSPEIYFGYFRNEFLANGKRGLSGEQLFVLPPFLLPNSLYLEGLWNIAPEYSENKEEGSISFKYEAKVIYMTAGSKEGVQVEVYQDGIFVKKIEVKDEQLYTLVENEDYGVHTVKIKILKAGLQAFTFTFG